MKLYVHLYENVHVYTSVSICVYMHMYIQKQSELEWQPHRGAATATQPRTGTKLQHSADSRMAQECFGVETTSGDSNTAQPVTADTVVFATTRDICEQAGQHADSGVWGGVGRGG